MSEFKSRELVLPPQHLYDVRNVLGLNAQPIKITVK